MGTNRQRQQEIIPLTLIHFGVQFLIAIISPIIEKINPRIPIQKHPKKVIIRIPPSLSLTIVRIHAVTIIKSVPSERPKPSQENTEVGFLLGTIGCGWV